MINATPIHKLTPTTQISKRLIYPEFSYKITGILFATYNKLGRYCEEILRRKTA